MDYVDRIIAALEKSGKTQRGLSLALGNDATLANKIISRTRKMQDSEFVPAADYLGVTVQWLLTGETLHSTSTPLHHAREHTQTSTSPALIASVTDLAKTLIEKMSGEQNPAPSKETKKRALARLIAYLTAEYERGITTSMAEKETMTSLLLDENQ